MASRSRSGRRRVAAALFLTTLLASCQTEGGEPLPDTMPSESQTGTATGTSSAKSEGGPATFATREPTSMPDADSGRWAVIAGPSAELIPPFLHDGTATVTGRETYNPPSEQVEVTVDGTETLRHETPDGWLLDHAQMNTGWLAIAEHDDETGDYAVWLYDRDGSATLVTDGSAAPQRHVIPQISLDGSHLVWNETRADGHVCLNARHTGTGDVEVVHCAEDSREVRWPNLNDGRVVWSEVDQSGCSILYHMALGGQDPRAFGTECEGFQGATDGDLAVWTEARLDSSRLSWANVVGRDLSSGETVELGDGVAGSVTICEGRAYWKHQKPGATEVRSWRPGGDVAVVHESAENKGATTAPACADGWLSLGQTYTGPGTMTTEVITHAVGSQQQRPDPSD